MTPGPVEVPPSVLAVASQQAPHHRTPEYRKALKAVHDGLQTIFQTKNRILMFSASGSGAMEAAMVNVTAPGDIVIVASAGVFGDRWSDIAKTYGVNVVSVNAEWGEGVDPAEIDKALAAHKAVKAVFTTLSETSTGVDHPVQKIGEVCKIHGVLCVVDAISGMGASPMKSDEWSIDIVVVGSQKALLIPPGLAFASVSDRAWEIIKGNSRPRFYFDFERSRKAWEKEEMPDTPFTSSTSLVLQLREAVRILTEEGMEHVWARHAQLADFTRVGVTSMGLKLFAKNHASQVVTSVHVPEGVDGKKLVKTIRDQYGLSLAGGQKHLEGRIFRIGHVGYVDQFDVVTALTAVKLALAPVA